MTAFSRLRKIGPVTIFPWEGEELSATGGFWGERETFSSGIVIAKLPCAPVSSPNKTHWDTHTQRQRETETERQTQKETETQK